jgi:hypothetical protein
MNHEIAIRIKRGMREGDYSRMVRLFGGELLSSHGFFPLSAMALGFSWRRKTRGSEMMEA